MVGKDLWVNFHNMGNEDITIATKPTLVVEPYNGITEPPAARMSRANRLATNLPTVPTLTLERNTPAR